MIDELTDRPDNWTPDAWDEVGEAARVEPVTREHRLLKWTVWAAFGLAVCLVLVAGYVGWWYLGKVRPDDEQAGELTSFTVSEIDTVKGVAARLETQGLIADAELFEWYIDKQGGLDLSPGFYQLRTGDHMGNVLARLSTPPADTYSRITFPEGFTLEQMAERVAEENPRLSAENFMAAATSGLVVSSFSPPGVNTLEGLLFPDTYQVSNADNEGQVVERMVSLMERVAGQEDLEARAADLGVTPYEIFIIASMIEREAKVADDRPKIARVIYNRLEIEMLLQIDATLYYDAGDFDGPFSELRQIDGPYNTYLRPGLPPTPIANPGRASLRAALNPAPNPPPGDPVCTQMMDVVNQNGLQYTFTDSNGNQRTRDYDVTLDCKYFFYVLADADGTHVFSSIVEQHEVNVQRAREAGLL